MSQQEQKQQQDLQQPQISRPKRTGVSGLRNWDDNVQQLRTRAISLIEKFKLPLVILSNDYVSIPLPSFYPSRNDYNPKDIPSDFSLSVKKNGKYKVGYYKNKQNNPFTFRSVAYTMRKFPYQFIQKQNEYASVSSNYNPLQWHEFVIHLLSRSQVHTQVCMILEVCFLECYDIV